MNLIYDGKLRDRVGGSETVVAPDGALDGTFTLSFTSAKTITKLALIRQNLTGAWDTVPNNIYWALGVASGLDSTLLNAGDGSVNFTVEANGSVKIFASDFQGTEFIPGSQFTLTATFSNNSTAAATFTIPVSQPEEPPPDPPLTGPWKLNVITDGGAVGDGVADDSDAIIDTFNLLRPGGWLEIPPPPVAYKLTRTWYINKPVRVECGWPSYDYFAGTPQMTLKDAKGTKLKWAGAAGETMVYVTPGVSDGVNAKGMSVKLDGLILDCAGSAAYGLKCDRVRASVIQDVITLHATAIGIVIGSTSSVANDGSFQSTFARLRAIASPIGVSLRAFDGGNTGAYYCSFYDTYPDTSVYGTQILNGDNNCYFHYLSNQQDRQNGKALHIGPSGVAQGNPNLAYNSYFFHGGFEGGVQVDAGNPEAGIIFGYDKINGEPEPTVGSGSILTVVEAGGLAVVGRRLTLS